MEKRFVRFSDIPQYRNVIRNVIRQSQFVGMDEDGEPILNPNAEKPTITFNGTVKLHGTCSSFCLSYNNDIWYQSRNRIVTVEHDNHGFAHFCESRKKTVLRLLNQVADTHKDTKNIGIISIFGEFCGRGIQNGVAVAQLPPMFIIFAVKLTPSDVDKPAYYINSSGLNSPDDKIYNINDFETFSVDVDFNHPELAQAEFVKIVNAIEENCPVGVSLGAKDNTVGEGVVWVGWYDNVRHVMKTKGAKHSISRVKVVAEVDVAKVNSIMEFVEYAVTENRMEQGIEEVFTSTGEEIVINKMGDFLRWVVKDIAKEEMDVLLKNELTLKDVGRSISNKARPWFQALLNKNAGLIY